jgi:hypothetical protein
MSASLAPWLRAHLSAAASEYLATYKRTTAQDGTPAVAVWLSAINVAKAGIARLIITITVKEVVQQFRTASVLVPLAAGFGTNGCGLQRLA